VALLKSTLDRLDGKAQQPSLTGAQLFKDATAHVSADADAVLFVRIGDFIKRLTDVMAMAGQPVQEEQLAELKKTQALAGSLKFDGPNMRDSFFVLTNAVGKAQPITRKTMALTTKDTLVYYAAQWQLKGGDLKNAGAANPALAAIFSSLEQSLKAQGLDFEMAGDLFGPEVSFLMDWPAGSQVPAPVLALDIKDKAKAAQFLGVLTSGTLGNVPWDKRESSEAVYFIKTGSVMMTVSPVLAVTDKMLLFGLSVDAVKSAIARGETPGGKLDESAAYKQAGASVAQPRNCFGFVDAAALFDRVYTLARPALVMAPMFAPQVAQHVALDKLPGTETITKHLGPISYSQSEFPNGILVESCGPVTMNQSVVGAGVVVAAVAIPLAKSGMAGMVAPGLSPGSPSVQPQAMPEPAPEAPVPSEAPAGGPDATNNGQ
jgi:hypothetical protein